jgi:hypothetical protein
VLPDQHSLLFSLVEIELLVVHLFLFFEQIGSRISLFAKQINQWGVLMGKEIVV